MPVIPGDAINPNCVEPDQTQQNATSDQGLHSLLTGNYIRNRIKMKQDTRQPLNDKLSQLIRMSYS